MVTLGTHTHLLRMIPGPHFSATAGKVEAFDHLLDGISPKGWELPWPRHGILGRLRSRLAVSRLDASGQLGTLLGRDELCSIQTSNLLFWGALRCRLNPLRG
jgi:hypothetical protein